MNPNQKEIVAVIIFCVTYLLISGAAVEDIAVEPAGGDPLRHPRHDPDDGGRHVDPDVAALGSAPMPWLTNP